MSEIRWTDADTHQSALWRSATQAPPPRHVVLADDAMSADTAYRLARRGTALLWRGDFHNARQLLRAMGRRAERAPRRRRDPAPDSFHRYRRDRAQRARVLNMLLVPLENDHTLALRRAPDVREACRQAYGAAERRSVVALPELLGVLGAHQWRLKGVEVPALSARIHPHYGVFSPVRGEYVDLVAQAPLPPATARTPWTAFDIGTGTGVLAAVLVHRGTARVVATDTNPRALRCARDNARRLGMADRIEVVEQDLFPPGRAALVVCNPPWIPAQPTSPLEQGVYDPENRMLHGFLNGLAEHLQDGGEGWLVLSDIAEHLGLRTRARLLAAFAAAHLRVIGRTDTRPRHPRAVDPADRLHAARAAEVTSLWRLAPVKRTHGPSHSAAELDAPGPRER